MKEGFGEFNDEIQKFNACVDEALKSGWTQLLLRYSRYYLNKIQNLLLLFLRMQNTIPVRDVILERHPHVCVQLLYLTPTIHYLVRNEQSIPRGPLSGRLESCTIAPFPC